MCKEDPSFTFIIFELGSKLYSFIIGLKKYSLGVSESNVIFPSSFVCKLLL